MHCQRLNNPYQKGLNTMPTAALHDYQIAAKNFILTHPKCGLFLPVGLGKTVSTLQALYELNPTSHVLVIAPINVAKATWIDEIRKWDYPFRYKSLILNERGKKLTRKKRLKLYEEACDLFDGKPGAAPTIYFINRELVPDIVDNMPIRNGVPMWCFPTVIIDELQSFKSYNALRFKKLKYVSNCIFRFIGLTGTPTPKSLEDLWSEVYLMDDGARLGRTITQYRDMYFNPGMKGPGGYPVEWIPKLNAETLIYAAIKDIVISMKNTAIKLPPLTYNDMTVYMDESEQKLYKELKTTQVLTLDPDNPITAVNAAVLAAKLSQMASGTIYTDENHNYTVVHTKKLEMTEYIINNADSPVLLAYHFNSELDILLKYLSDAGIDARKFDGTPDMQHEWNAGHIQCMLIQPASAGAGLNLQQGGNTLIWYTLPWSLEEYIQTEGRIYRQGQSKPVIIHRLMTKGTIDSRIIQRLNQKDKTQQNLLDAVELVTDTLRNNDENFNQ